MDSSMLNYALQLLQYDCYDSRHIITFAIILLRCIVSHLIAFRYCIKMHEPACRHAQVSVLLTPLC